MQNSAPLWELPRELVGLLGLRGRVLSTPHELELFVQGFRERTGYTHHILPSHVVLGVFQGEELLGGCFIDPDCETFLATAHLEKASPQEIVARYGKELAALHGVFISPRIPSRAVRSGALVLMTLLCLRALPKFVLVGTVQPKLARLFATFGPIYEDRGYVLSSAGEREALTFHIHETMPSAARVLWRYVKKTGRGLIPAFR